MRSTGAAGKAHQLWQRQREEGDVWYWGQLGGPEEEVGCELHNAFRVFGKRERVSCTETHRNYCR